MKKIRKNICYENYCCYLSCHIWGLSSPEGLSLESLLWWAPSTLDPVTASCLYTCADFYWRASLPPSCSSLGFIDAELFTQWTDTQDGQCVVSASDTGTLQFPFTLEQSGIPSVLRRRMRIWIRESAEVIPVFHPAQRKL